jgi:enterochelin esterase-like enzyme
LLPRDLDPFVGWVENETLRQKKLFLAWGTGDSTRIRQSNEVFASRLDESGLEFTRQVYEGGHKWIDWKHVIEKAIGKNLPTKL